MRKLSCPIDNGLKKQVRSFEDTFSAFECIRGHFKMTPNPDDNEKYLCKPDPDAVNKYRVQKTRFNRESW